MQITVRNVNEGLTVVPELIQLHGHEEQTRNGRVKTVPEPVTLTTLYPAERAIHIPTRKQNTLLFLLDGLSILSNRRWLKPFADIVPRFKDFSDDGMLLRGHYGARLDSQLGTAIQMLKDDPMGRRNTLQIWEHDQDQNAQSVDVPCNVHINLRGIVRRGVTQLDLTVFNRSNDVYWGMLGANAVQFSFLLEYLARSSGMGIGQMHQVTTNLHMYLDFGPGKSHPFGYFPPGWIEKPTPLDLRSLPEQLNVLFDCLARANGHQFLRELAPQLGENLFIRQVVLPMIQAWTEGSSAALAKYPDNDWFQSMCIEKGW